MWYVESERGRKRQTKNTNTNNSILCVVFTKPTKRKFKITITVGGARTKYLYFGEWMLLCLHGDHTIIIGFLGSQIPLNQAIRLVYVIHFHRIHSVLAKCGNLCLLLICVVLYFCWCCVRFAVLTARLDSFPQSKFHVRSMRNKYCCCCCCSCMLLFSVLD